MYIKIDKIGNSKNGHYSTHIYIITLIYVYQNVQNWKIEKRKDLSVLAHENYICNSERKKLKHKKEN